MKKTNLLKLLSNLAIGACLVGCKEAPLPDPYYLQLDGVKLAIPQKYARAGSGLNAPSNYDSIRQLASSPPGMEIVEFLMRLDFEDAKPHVHDPNFKGIHSGLDIWFSTAAREGSGKPEVQIQHKLLNERRRPQNDEFGLVAYAVEFESAVSDKYYFAKISTESPFIIHCKGFGFVNPLCQATFTWRGLVIDYKTRHIYLNQWKDTHARVLKLLESFTYNQ